MWVWSRILKVCWNPMRKVLWQVQEERKLNKTVGHIHNSLMRKVIEGKIEGKKTRESPRTVLLGHLMNKWRLKVRATE